MVPSLTLVSQILRTWTEQRVAHGVDLNWFAVCSDGPVGNNRQDQLVSSKYDLGIPRSTDVDEAAAWLSEDSTGTKLTVTTYSSGPALAQAASKVGLSFDLVIMDEAHKTVGDRKKRFGHLLDGSNLLGRNSVTNRVTWERLRGLECDTKVHQRRGQECKFHESLRPPTGGSLPGELSLLRRPNS